MQGRNDVPDSDREGILTGRPLRSGALASQLRLWGWGLGLTTGTHHAGNRCLEPGQSGSTRSGARSKRKCRVQMRQDERQIRSMMGGGEQRGRGWAIHTAAIRISFLFLFKTFRLDQSLRSAESLCWGRRYLFWPTYLRSVDVFGTRRWKLCFINLTAPSQESLKF